MGEEREFTFNMDREIYGFESADQDLKDNAAERYINVLIKYRKMITYEKTGRRIKDQIGKATMAKKMKENLKEARRVICIKMPSKSSVIPNL